MINNRPKYQHVWVGTCHDEEQFEQYFELDYSTEGDFEHPSYKKCGFCLDNGMVFYDEDYMVRIFYGNEQPVNSVLVELPSQKIKDLVMKRCEEERIQFANFLYYYSDIGIDDEKISSSNIDGKYLGCFEY